MKRLLMEASVSEEDLKNKDVAEVVDCIINQFGGLKAVQRELRKKGIVLSKWVCRNNTFKMSTVKYTWMTSLTNFIGPVFQTLPRTAGASISHALQKGPLPPVPSTQSSRQTAESTATTNNSQDSPPAAPEPGRMRRSASFKDVRGTWVSVCIHICITQGLNQLLCVVRLARQ